MLTKPWSLVLMTLVLAPSARAKDYENFDLPKETPKVALPQSGFAYQSPRVSIRAAKTKLSGPSLDHSQFMFAKEAFLTEKRDEAIKLLRQDLDAGIQSNQDNVLLRLGQLYAEKYMELNFREGEIYSAQYRDFEEKKAAGKKVEPPKMDNSRSQHYIKEALAVFYNLEKKYPKHPKMDEVSYFIGFVEMESGNGTKGQKYLERVLKSFPQSRKFDEAAIYLGDYYFDKHKFKEASQNYQLIVKRGSSLKDYATYKLAWCELNIGSSEKALRDMKALITYLAGTPDTAKFSLREQALRDLVVFYAETERVEDAMDFFAKVQGKSKALDNLKTLADIYRSKAKDQAAVKAYTRLISEFSDAPETPRWYLGLYECQSRLGQSKGGVDRLVELMEKYGETSSWAKNYPSEKAGELKETLDLISAEAEKAAFFNHQAGQKSANKGHYQTAIRIYSSLLENFPNYANRKKVAFFKGEALFAQEKWIEAADAYMMAAQVAPKDKLSDESVYNALLAIDRLTARVDKLERYTKEQQKNLDTTPEEIPKHEQKFIEIGNYYLKEYPKGDRVVDVKFRIASIYYTRKHFDEAQKRYQEIATSFPTHRTATTAAHIVLDIFNIRKEYDRLTETAQGFYSNKQLGDNEFKSEMKQIVGELDFKKIEPLEKENKWAEAGAKYFSFYQNNPTGNLAEKSLYNAYISYEKSGDELKSTEMARVFIAKFPKSEYVPKMTLSLAKLSEKRFDFEQAQKQYEDFHEKYPKDKEASKALYNAAVFAELLEMNKKALALYEQYRKEVKLNAEENRAILISQAKIYRKQGNWDQFATIYRQLIRQSGKNSEKLGYLAEMARQYERAGKVANRDTILKEIRATYDRKDKSAAGLASLYAAEAEFSALKPQREKYQAIKLRFPADDLLYLMKRKEKALVKLAGNYDAVVEFGVPEWGVAALHEKAMAYQDYVNSFRSLKIPKSLKPEEKTEVETSLKAIDQKLVVPLETKAQEILKVCTERASQFKVFSTYAGNCYDKMRKEAGEIAIQGLYPQPNYWSLRSAGEGVAKR